MDFPVTMMKEIPFSNSLKGAFGDTYSELYESETKFMAVFENEQAIANLDPDFRALKTVGKNIIVTAKGDNCDFVSRLFAPFSGIDEDPVTGSAHTALIPYWTKRLGK